MHTTWLLNMKRLACNTELFQGGASLEASQLALKQGSH